MNRAVPWLIFGSAAILGAIGMIWWTQSQQAAQPVPAPPRAEAPLAPPAPAEPKIRHPIEQARPESEAPQLATPLPSLDQSDKLVQSALLDLLGRESVQRFLNVDDFVRHVVATVDNLPSKKAALRLWPVNPTTGRFAVDGQGNGAVLSADNERRYVPFIRFVESVDTGRAVAAYVRLYPLFQRAYAELGYPDHYFNDRLVEVIDHLLAAPEVTGPIELARPWIMYEYADPDIEARSAGQKMLIRTGSENAKRLKTKLREIRRQIASAPVRP